MYTDEMLESMKKVELSRKARIGQVPRRMTAEEKDILLAENHPDYIESAFTTKVKKYLVLWQICCKVKAVFWARKSTLENLSTSQMC